MRADLVVFGTALTVDDTTNAANVPVVIADVAVRAIELASRVLRW